MRYIIPHQEKSLIEKCKKGERIAQRELFLKYKDAMYTILLRMLNDGDKASDALQESFVEVFRSLKKFQFKSSLGAWIKTITIRTGIRHQKHNHKMAFSSIDEAEEEPIIWPDYMNAEILEQAIAKLSPGYRTVFLLVEVEGYTHKEVAKMMGISEGTSKSQLYHSKRHLKKYLEGYQYEAL